jgi:hypothetical protein
VGSSDATAVDGRPPDVGGNDEDFAAGTTGGSSDVGGVDGRAPDVGGNDEDFAAGTTGGSSDVDAVDGRAPDIGGNDVVTRAGTTAGSSDVAAVDGRAPDIGGNDEDFAAGTTAGSSDVGGVEGRPPDVGGDAADLPESMPAPSERRDGCTAGSSDIAAVEGRPPDVGGDAADLPESMPAPSERRDGCTAGSSDIAAVEGRPPDVGGEDVVTRAGPGPTGGVGATGRGPLASAGILPTDDGVERGRVAVLAAAAGGADAARAPGAWASFGVSRALPSALLSSCVAMIAFRGPTVPRRWRRWFSATTVSHTEGAPGRRSPGPSGVGARRRTQERIGVRRFAMTSSKYWTMPWLYQSRGPTNFAATRPSGEIRYVSGNLLVP